MKKRRSALEQATAVARVRAAVTLQQFRPKRHKDPRAYNRTEQRRRWQKDQEAPLALDAPHKLKAELIWLSLVS